VFRSIIAGLMISLMAASCSAREQRTFEELREDMVETQLVERGIGNSRVLKAMRSVPREEFVPQNLQTAAYDDSPLPIGYRQTISQPYIVAYMTEKLDPKPGDRVLEIGTGSGYQAAVLSHLVKEVYTIEIVEPLARSAEAALKRSGCRNVFVRAGDGYRGWPEKAPFDAIIVTAAPDHVPKPLVDQLKEGGKLVIPLGAEFQIQSLKVFRKEAGVLLLESDLPVRFVPMTGEAQK
jgi:protein-L-isoaspartate(D-aspartate) O-methyltransferase